MNFDYFVFSTRSRSSYSLVKFVITITEVLTEFSYLFNMEWKISVERKCFLTVFRQVVVSNVQRFCLWKFSMAKLLQVFRRSKLMSFLQFSIVEFNYHNINQIEVTWDSQEMQFR